MRLMRGEAEKEYEEVVDDFVVVMLLLWSNAQC